MTKLTVALVLFASSVTTIANACPRCRPLVKSGIYNASFIGNVLLMALPIAVLLLFAAGCYYCDALAAWPGLWRERLWKQQQQQRCDAARF